LEKIEMKKTLVAVAALAAIAGAQADVSITGVMESTYTLNGANKGLGNGMNGGSEFRLGGSEDLGNGLKADFNYAFVQNHNNSAAIANYNSYVGLGGDFGSVKLGAQFTPLALATWGNDAEGGAANATNLANGSGTQATNSLTYTSPSIMGLTAAYQLSTNTGATKSTGYSLTYANGPFSASYSANTTGTAKEITGLGANYDLGVAKVFLNTLNQSGARSATGYGVSVPVGAATFIASASTQGSAENYALVGKYSLSKRTLVYLQSASKSKTVTNSVGISHSF